MVYLSYFFSEVNEEKPLGSRLDNPSPPPPPPTLFTGRVKVIFKKGRKPKCLWTDKGKVFYNKHVKNLLDSEGIDLYSTENEESHRFVKDGIEQ